MLKSFRKKLTNPGCGDRRRHRGCPDTALVAELLDERTLLSAVTVQAGVLQDTTIYDLRAGDVANGAGQYILVGGEGSDEVRTRALISFNLGAAGIPSGATILDAVLTLHASYTIGGAADFSLHRLTTAWGEAGSNAPGNERDGDQARQSDATWLFSFFDGASWQNPGGDFAPGSSAVVNVAGTGSYQWSSSDLIRDVQGWIDNTSSDFGWLLLGDQIPGSLVAFDSRESSNAAMRPTLEITYETPLLPTIVQGRTWNDKSGDGLKIPSAVNDLRLQYYQGRNLFNVYGGNEYWYRSDVNQAWYFLTSSGQLTRWDGQSKKLTGQLTAQLDSRFWSNPTELLYSTTAVSETFLNGVTVQLVNSAGTVVSTAITGDRDLDGDGRIASETESGWYRFQAPPAGNYSVRILPSQGWVESGTAVSSKAHEVFDLKTSMGLSFQNSYYENCGFRGERWLRSSTGWVFITPAGDLYAWSGKHGTASSPVAGTLITVLGPAYYRDPSLIWMATNPTIRVQEGETSTVSSLGLFQPATVSGRSWFDRNGDGIRSPETFSTARSIPRPTGAPESGFTWFAVTSPVGTGGATTETYFYASGTQLFQWSAAGGSVYFTEVWGGAVNSPSQILQAVFTPELWQNGTQIELLNDRGYVVTTALTKDVDLNGDKKIDAGTESGWYSFGNLIPGNYTIREVPRGGWLASTPAPSVSLQFQAETLQQQLGLRASAKDWYNFGGRKERWFQGRRNEWYFIIPNGTVYEWDRISGGTNGPAGGRQIAKLSASFYINTDLLFRPRSATVSVASGQSVSGINFGNHKVVDGLFSSLTNELLGL